MADDSDANDRRLLENGEIDVLLAKYLPIVLDRCRAKLWGHPDAEDVAQAVMLRLVDEFHRGKRYGQWPYRVVVHQVIRWTVADYFAGRRLDSPLPDDLVTSGDIAEGIVAGLYLEALLAELDGQDGEVARFRYGQGLEPEEIAAELGMKRNAVDQALWRARKKLVKELKRDE